MEGHAVAGEAGTGLSGASHPWAWRGGTLRAETVCAATTERPPLPIPRAATSSQVGAGLRGLLGAGRQGAAQRPARPDVAGPAGAYVVCLVYRGQGDSGRKDVWN